MVSSNLGPMDSVASRLLGLASQKSWQDRVKQAVYVSPVSGERFTFAYEDLSRSFDVRGSAFDFPGVNDSYVQQTGYSSRKYPMNCFFSGKNCDLLASGFEAALMEPGIGQLQHPIYGTFPALPFGTVERNDALKTASNQSVVTVTFWTSIPAIYPDASSSGTNELEGALDLFNAAVASQFASNLNLSTVLNKQSVISRIRGFQKQASGGLSAFKKYSGMLGKVKKALNSIANTVASVRNGLGAALTAINDGLDVLIGAPLLLAQQISNLIQFPGRALTGLASRLDAYERLAADIFGSKNGTTSNDFHVANLFAMNAVAGSIVSVIAQPITATVNGQVPIFGNRRQVLDAAAAVLAQMDALVAWRDAGFAALTDTDGGSPQSIDTGEAYSALQDLVARTAGYLIQASFSALPERAIVLDRRRTIVDLCAELYGAVDSKIDLLVSTNDFTGDELLELPQGRRILYYPQGST